MAECTSLAALRQHLLIAGCAEAAGILGISFPDTVTTKQQFLVPIDRGLYRVRQDRPACITRSGVVRVGAHFLTLDYGPFSAFRLSNLRAAASRPRDRVLAAGLVGLTSRPTTVAVGITSRTS